jgi:type VI secretion system secreted protein VgrG
MSERIELVTPLGDELLFHGMRAHEELSRLGEYELDLLSLNKDVDRDKLLGGKVTIKVLLHDGEVRYFNGFVTRFSAGGSLGRYARYHATVSPWLWFLTRTADCRIFQDKTVKEIVEEVFADHPDVADFVFELTESYQTWKYCVQYRETDFNFVSRLMEHEGMYFRQTDGHHRLVITDSMDKHDPAPGHETLQFIPAQALVRPGTEHISTWDISQEVQPGKYVHDDYDFERPSVDLTTLKTLPRGYALSDYEVFDYPGAYLQKPDGERYAHVRIDEYGARFEKAQARTNYRGVQVGARFTLEGHEIGRINGEYLVVAASQTLESTEYESGDSAASGEGFSCTFTALSCSQQFRPLRLTPKPFVQGPQTAIVTGAAGDEIHTDKYGRVKVQFHWDRKGKKDENSSCWIRVSHPWAGKGWGSVSTPRVGQEVIVDFLEGDPDQPIITGRVYNEENQPPFGFPEGAVSSGIKSATHKGSGYNQLAMDDTTGKEKITIHGQYDMGTTVQHDQTNTVNNDFTETIKKNATITITEGKLSHDVVAGTATYHVKGAVEEIYDDTQTTVVKNKLTIVSTAGPIEVSSDTQKISVTAATEIKLEVGASTLLMKSDGSIELSGVSIAIDGSQKVAIHGGQVSSEADTSHDTKGNIVLSEGAATNTVKGGMVMLNP